jgi:uncharacterized alpha-E superfamily protein
MERADFTAPILQASRRLAALPKAYGDAESEWKSLLTTTGAAAAFHASGRPLDEINVADFMTFAPENPGSILNCIERARQWPRGAHGAHHRDVGDDQ